MAFGAAIWSVMTAASGMASSFAMQVITRAGVGLGESAYTVLASPVLAHASPAQDATQLHPSKTRKAYLKHEKKEQKQFKKNSKKSQKQIKKQHEA